MHYSSGSYTPGANRNSPFADQHDSVRATGMCVSRRALHDKCKNADGVFRKFMYLRIMYSVLAREVQSKSKLRIQIHESVSFR